MAETLSEIKDFSKNKDYKLVHKLQKKNNTGKKGNPDKLKERKDRRRIHSRLNKGARTHMKSNGEIKNNLLHNGQQQKREIEFSISDGEICYISNWGTEHNAIGSGRELENDL